MMYALVHGVLVEASQDGPRRGEAPCCGVEVIAKTGERVAWHWAHADSSDCDPWSEPEGPWHRNWKRKALDSGCQVEVPYRVGRSIVHRADIVTPSGVIVEIQYSGIGVDEIWEREHFYAAAGGIAWVFAAGWMDNARLVDATIETELRAFHSQRKHRTSFVRAPQFWHHQSGLFLVEGRPEWYEGSEETEAWLSYATTEDVFDPSMHGLRAAWASTKQAGGVPCASCGARPTGTFHDGSPRYQCHLGDPDGHRPLEGEAA